MPFRKIAGLLIAATLISLVTMAQRTDSTALYRDSLPQASYLPASGGQARVTPFRYLAVPAACILYGVTSLGNRQLRNINDEVKEELYLEHPHQQLHIDDYLLYSPAVLVYGLNLAGIHGKNNLRDRTMIYLLSNIIMESTVTSVKTISHQLRPDGSAYTSFPSGHTAEAFASAEFLRQEYKDVSPWYGIAGYALAGATGYLRMYNNRHWLGDVIAGAGVGMLSTKVAYWIYPWMKQHLFHDTNKVVLPTFQNGQPGLQLAIVF